MDSNASQRCGGNSQGINTNILAGGLTDLQHRHTQAVIALVRGAGAGLKPRQAGMTQTIFQLNAISKPCQTVSQPSCCYCCVTAVTHLHPRHQGQQCS